MKKHIIFLSFISIMALALSCKKEQVTDPRDKFVGTYTGRATNDDFFYPHKIHPDDPYAKLTVVKHPTINNALQVIYADVSYPNIGYNYSTEYYDYEVLFYVSQKGLLYIKGTGYYDFNRNCQFIEPDSLFTTVPIDNNGVLRNYFFRMKKN